jgi:hypothetical protein
MCFTGKWLGEGDGHTWIWYTFRIATIKWLIVLIPVLIPDCLSNIYLLEVEIYSDHWLQKTLNKYWSINRNVFYFIVLQFYFYTIKIKYKHAA